MKTKITENKDEFTITFPDGCEYKFNGSMDDEGKITSDSGDLVCWVDKDILESVEIKEKRS